MTGVEILATQEIVVEFGFCWTGFFAMLLFGGMISIFLAVAMVYCDNFQRWATFGACLGFTLILSVLVGIVADGEPTKYETQYKVTISDEVSMNEFLERYEIIDQEGKIYTVREVE